MRILVTGASGFIGTALCHRLDEAGHEVAALSRDPERARRELPVLDAAFAWQATQEEAPAEAFAGVDAVVHLAGEPVSGRWTASKKAAIRDSRVLGTRHLVAGMAAAETSPRVLVSGSAIGYYGDRGDESLDESSAAGDDFLADVCQAWEREAREAERHGTTVVRVRTGIVLGDGGALQEMMLPAKLGLNGPMGSGRQWWSWIHIDDEVGVLEHALGLEQDCALAGSAPEPVRQRDFARELGRVLRRPAFLPAPALALRIVLGGFASELLSSRRVLPEHTLRTGYSFRFPELADALEDVLR
ncbi:MAG: TIGR01777 family oxidoreductase [Acidobacteriota bacterium]